MEELAFQNITTDLLTDPFFEEKNIEVSVLRLDKIHPVISGNKWFKLKFYLEEAVQKNKRTIATFGGAWSNHIVATAAACRMNGLKSIGIIRGEEPKELSQTLKDAKEYGMELFFLNRRDYKKKKVPDTILNEECYLIPEGGYGKKGAEGASTILNYCNKDHFTHICCAIGTGTMMAGLVNASSEDQEVTGISVLKNNFELEEKIHSLLNRDSRFCLDHTYHFGGYAKYNQELIRFINEWYRLHHIPSDFVYSGKLFFAVRDLIANEYFPSGSKILIIHCGGLQGNRSLAKGLLIF